MPPTSVHGAGAAAPRVSAIVIFYNAAKYLDEAIDSIAAQTFGDWELLLVDDGSTDGSRAIAERWAAGAPERMRVLEHPGRANLGMSAARNAGIAAARGEWIAFLDADDVWLPDKLEHQLRVLGQHPGADMVYGPTSFWHSWTGRDEDRQRDKVAILREETDRVLEPPALLALALETDGGSTPGIGSVMARRSKVLEVGAFEPEFRGCYEDQVFLARMFLRARIVVTGRCTDRYRQHDESCCAQAVRAGEYAPDRPHPARDRYLTWLERHFAAERVADERLLRALRRCLLPYRRPLQWRLQTHVTRAAARGLRIARKTARRVLGPVGPAAARGAHAALATGSVWIAHRRGGAPGPSIETHYLRRLVGKHAPAPPGRVLLAGLAATDAGLAPGTHVDVLPANDIGSACRGGDRLPAAALDCAIVAGEAAAGFDLAAARELERVLKVGGTGLVVFPVGRERRAAQARLDALHDALTTVFPVGLVATGTLGNAWTHAAARLRVPAGGLPARRLERVDGRFPVLHWAHVQKPDAAYLQHMTGRWHHAGVAHSRFGDETTYRLALAWLDGHGVVEDWGCGRGHARRFLAQSPYVGVDGTATPWARKVVDLRTYRTSVDCVLVRHVLEHNREWQRVLDNALASFRRRMALVLFTPWAEATTEIGCWSGIPDLSLCRAEVLARFPADVRWREETLATGSQYGVEHVFYLER